MTFKSLSNRLANLLVEDNKKNWPAIAAIFIIILFPVIFLAGLTFFRARQQLECKVEDNRIGIPAEMLPFIFDKFRQVDSSDTRSYDGVGLGLYIAKEFADFSAAISTCKASQRGVPLLQ